MVSRHVGGPRSREGDVRQSLPDANASRLSAGDLLMIGVSRATPTPVGRGGWIASGRLARGASVCGRVAARAVSPRKQIRATAAVRMGQ